MELQLNPILHLSMEAESTPMENLRLLTQEHNRLSKECDLCRRIILAAYRAIENGVL